MAGVLERSGFLFYQLLFLKNRVALRLQRVRELWNVFFLQRECYASPQVRKLFPSHCHTVCLCVCGGWCGGGVQKTWELVTQRFSGFDLNLILSHFFLYGGVC